MLAVRAAEDRHQSPRVLAASLGPQLPRLLQLCGVRAAHPPVRRRSGGMTHTSDLSTGPDHAQSVIDRPRIPRPPVT